MVLLGAQETGKHLSQWRLHYDDNGTLKSFGSSFFIETHTAKSEKMINKENKLEDEEAENVKRVQSLAETLNMMFPGDLESKVKFVEGYPSNYNIHNLVDKYLEMLRNGKKSFISNKASGLQFSV